MDEHATVDTARGVVVNVIAAFSGQLIGGPEGVAVGAAAQPVLDQAGREVQGLFERVPGRVKHLLGYAASRAGLSVADLCEKLERERGGEDLLLKTMRAAVDTGIEVGRVRAVAKPRRERFHSDLRVPVCIRLSRAR